MKKQSQNDYYYTIAQLCKTNDTNKFEAFDTAREQKIQAILHVKLLVVFWCGAPGHSRHGFKLCMSLGIPTM
jgi:hypothetical protein